MTSGDEANHTEESTVKIYEAENMLEANLIKQTLAQQGIECLLQSNMSPGILPTDSGPLGGVGRVRIFVLVSEAESAKEIIQNMLDERQHWNNENAGDNTPAVDSDSDEGAGEDSV